MEPEVLPGDLDRANLGGRVLHPCSPGDHVIVSDVIYGRVLRLFDSLLPIKLGINVDIIDLDAVYTAVCDNTRLMHTEAMPSPTRTCPQRLQRHCDNAPAIGTFLTQARRIG